MLAVVKSSAERGIEVRTDWPEPTAGPGQVLLQVAAASLCGTDRELYEWTPSAQAFGLNLPVALGHEGSGTVLEVGDGVEGLLPGDRVALESHLICGHCWACRTGNAHTCENTRILGMHIDGVFAERVAVPAAICVKLPDSVSLEVGALLESAGVAMHSVQRGTFDWQQPGVLVVGEGQPYSSREVARALNSPVVATVPDDPESAAVFSRGAQPPKRFQAGALARGLHAAIASIHSTVSHRRGELLEGVRP